MASERIGDLSFQTERRRYVRRQVASRSALEVERLQRLRKLSRLLQAYKSLPANERSQKGELLKEQMGHIQMQTIYPASDTVVDMAESWSPSADWKLEGVPVSGHLLPSRTSDYSPWTKYQDYELSYIPEGDNEELGPHVLYGQPSVQTIVSDLADLYREYHLSSLGIASQQSPKSTPLTYSEEITTGRQHELISESKLQASLTQEEGLLWSSIVSEPAKEEVISTSIISDLANRSQFLSESYERRSKAPSAETYEESKGILRAMGIPYIECDGPYEAEALASSLVIRGHAHYVASEDTVWIFVSHECFVLTVTYSQDVLIYGAPMLRNLTTRNAPLSLIYGADVPSTLQLSWDSFVDFALLLGTDFSRRIKNIGPMRALKLIQTHGSIENILERESQHIPWDRKAKAAYLAEIELARLVFRNLPEVPVHADLEMKASDGAVVNDLLTQYGLRREVMEEDWDFGAPLAGNYFDDSPSVGLP